MTVELVYDRDCPHIEETRANLVRALREAGQPASWTEWERSSTDSPTRVREFGSPTVLVDGRDMAGETPTVGGSCCRLYDEVGGRRSGVPPVELIREALGQAGHPAQGTWKRCLAVAPAIGVAFLPKLTCPMCWPAYAALLTTLGVSFLISERYLFGVTAFFLLLSVGALAFRARARRGRGPALLGLGGSAAVLFGKFGLDSTAVMYAGLGLLIAATLWNNWPQRPAESCPQCAPGGDELIQLSAKER